MQRPSMRRRYACNLLALSVHIKTQKTYNAHALKEAVKACLAVKPRQHRATPQHCCASLLLLLLLLLLLRRRCLQQTLSLHHDIRKRRL